GLWWLAASARPERCSSVRWSRRGARVSRSGATRRTAYGPASGGLGVRLVERGRGPVERPVQRGGQVVSAQGCRGGGQGGQQRTRVRVGVRLVVGVVAGRVPGRRVMRGGATVVVQQRVQLGYEIGRVHVQLAGQVDEDADGLVDQGAACVVGVQVVWVDAEQVAEFPQG